MAKLEQQSTRINNDLSELDALLIAHGIGYSDEDIKGPCRDAELVFMRSIIAIFLKSKGYRLSAIGKWMGNRTHATIINLIKYGRKQGRDPLHKEVLALLEVSSFKKRIKYHENQIKWLRAQMKKVK